MAVTRKPHSGSDVRALTESPTPPQPVPLGAGGTVPDELSGVLALISAALDSPDVCVVWRWTSEPVVSRVYVGRPPEERQPTRWLALSRRHADAATAHLDVGGHLVMPIPTGAAGLAAAIATRPATELLPRDALVLLQPTMHMIADVLRATQPRLSRLRAYEALAQIGTQIQAEQVHPDAVFESIVEHARELLAADVAWLGLMDAAGERMRLKVAAGATTDEFMRMEVDAGSGIGGLALEEGRAVTVQDVGSSAELTVPPGVATGLRREGVRSVLCAPMSRDGSMIGSLYVGSRELTEFSPEATSLLCALASQAAMTIENARLYQALADKHDTLEQSFAIHRLLTDASLSGAGLDAIASELTQVLKCDLVLTVDTANPRSHHYHLGGSVTPIAEGEGAHAQTLDSAEATVAIMAGATVLGSLRAVGEERLTALQRKALEHGATVIALELVKTRAALEVEWRMQAELLDELVRCDKTIPDNLRARAQRAGVDLTRARCIAVFAPDEDGSAARLLETARHTLRCNPRLEGLITRRGEHVVVAIGDEPAGKAHAAVRDLQNRARLAGIPASCGLSRPHHALTAALREAEAALGLAAAGRGGSTLVSYEELGPMRFLLDASNTDEMIGLVHDVLGPLAEHDQERGGELMTTLRAYLAAGGHHPTTSATCHIHVSTLKYRLSRIAAILDRSLTDPPTRFELSLAFEIMRVLGMVGIKPFDA